MEAPIENLEFLPRTFIQGGRITNKTEQDNAPSPCLARGDKGDTPNDNGFQNFLTKFSNFFKGRTEGTSFKDATPKEISDNAEELRIRKLMKKVTMHDQLDETVGNLEVRHFIEQSFLNENLSAELKWQALLLVGIPGCGKSMIMRTSAVQVAKLIKKPVSFFFVRSGDLYREYYGQSERTPQILYSLAKEEAPSIVVIDEIDGLMRSRGTDGETEATRRFKTSLLGEMQGVEPYSGVLTICSTNRAAELDSAFVRSIANGILKIWLRFNKIFCIGLPNRNERIQILKKFLKMLQKSTPFNMEEIDFELITDLTEGYTGDDLRKIVANVAYKNLKLVVDERVESFDNIEKYRSKLESSPNPANVISVPVKTHHLLDAVKEVQVTYKMKEIREIEKFKTDYHLGLNQKLSLDSSDNIEYHDKDYCCGLYKILSPC